MSVEVKLPAGFRFRPPDTSPDAWRFQNETLRRMGPEGRLRMMLNLSDSFHDVIREGIRRRHPEYDERQVGLAFIRLVHGEELFRRFFPGVEACP